jgi:hypothetical protein
MPDFIDEQGDCMNGIVRYESVEESGGDLFTMEEFADMCKNFAVMNDDGSGYLSDGKVVWNIPVDCRQISKGSFPTNVSAFKAEFTHVMWFNK